MAKSKRSDPPSEDSQQSRKRHRTSGVEKKSDVGFTLKLCDGEELVVSKSESQQLQDSCAFFRNAFRHGTLECTSHVISKPDWSFETALEILKLIQNQTLPVPDDYAVVKEAADQILLPIRILHPVSGTNISNDTALVQSIADTWKAATTCFTMNMESWNSSSRRRNSTLNPIWEDLLISGTVFVDRQLNGMQIQLIPENPIHTPPAVPANILSVGCFAPLTLSVHHACSRLSESLRNPQVARDAATHNKPACMALPLYCGGWQLLQEQFKDMEFLLIETNNVPTVNMTRVTAGKQELRRVVEAATDLIAPVHLAKLCYLLIPEPSIWTLGKLITACQQCQDDPGTVGWDLEKNQFCTLKTLRDTKLILDALLDPATKMATSGTIELVNVDMTAAPVWSPY